MKKTKIRIEEYLDLDEVTSEDGGQAKIITIYGPGEDSDGVFFRFQSWNETDRKHELFNSFLDKHVRITLEVIDLPSNKKKRGRRQHA